MYSRKNKREVVFAKRRISTTYSLVTVIAVTLSLGFAKDWFANNSSRYFRAFIHTCPILSTRFQWTKPGVRRSLVEK